MFEKIKSILRTGYISCKRQRQLQHLMKGKNEPTIFVLQTPTHTNIGDHAIAEAEMQFLKKHCKNFRVIEVNQDLHSLFIKNYGNTLQEKDIIMLHGGGNFGNQYMYEENIRRSAITSFPNNRIVSFPQTIYYTNDQIGQRELTITQTIIAKHKKLTLIAREQTSYELMQQYFPSTKILLTPDIVLSLHIKDPALERKGVLMVLRADEEKILNDQQQNELDRLARKYFGRVTYSDMHYAKGVSNQSGRDKVLHFKFNQFKTAELVITDRLHGMVFAAITQTPCIAFSNYNQKVSGTYEWIKNLNYIRFVDFSFNIEEEVNALLSIDKLSEFNPSLFDSYFQQIVSAIHE